jgi:predicted acyltransferase
MEEKKNSRLVSLDIFRGITIAGMILVNNPGSWGNIYAPLRHAEWHGCTPTDWIFPFFLFIVGVAVTLSLTKRKERGDNQNQIILNIFRRAAIIFLIGLFLSGFPNYDFSEIRIPGVLQRIAVVYFITSVIFLKTSLKTQIYLTGGFLVFYWLIMALVPVPGVGPANYDKITNLASWLDSHLLAGHMWKQTKTWDPEGFLSTIPAISTCLSGVLLGHFLRTKKSDAEKVAWITTSGAFFIVLGFIWSIFFPMNKSIWTSSYVVYTSGLALLFFGFCYWVVDVQGYKKWATPFVVYGMNAITVFAGSGLMVKALSLIKIAGPDGKELTPQGYFYQTMLVPYFEPNDASLIYALLFITLWLGILWVLYRYKIFIKI